MGPIHIPTGVICLANGLESGQSSGSREHSRAVNTYYLYGGQGGSGGRGGIHGGGGGLGEGPMIHQHFIMAARQAVHTFRLPNLVPPSPGFPSSMDDYTHSVSEDFTASYPGNPFTRPSQLTPPDGVFITNNFNQIPSVPSDFRMIPFGDIDLLREIRIDVGNNLVHWRRDRTCVRTCIRRTYAAKIEGTTSDKTVVLYQGDTAEEVPHSYLLESYLICGNSNGEKTYQHSLCFGTNIRSLTAAC
ncbi:hypothetical protein MSAN_02479300 [Mycena sanguinolenta]|uniref:Uncharacterized protein n=1 Tax=Mycena sanguinolenta TaxID=230812 RepID=A0A8H6U4C0_9AGAR|nr:hypothetical protein MSAN_02479300 [Mycena sanguinolenta]